jgi:hypothetical protein
LELLVGTKKEGRREFISPPTSTSDLLILFFLNKTLFVATFLVFSFLRYTLSTSSKHGSDREERRTVYK